MTPQDILNTPAYSRPGTGWNTGSQAGLTFHQHTAIEMMKALLSNPKSGEFTADEVAGTSLTTWADYAKAANQATRALALELSKTDE